MGTGRAKVLLGEDPPAMLRSVRFAHVLLAGSLVGGVVFVVGAGCRDATQVTLDISLHNASCNEIHGTAVTVGVEAADTEARVAAEYVTGSTAACDLNPTSVGGVPTHEIGTLVVTPSDTGRASIIVVVAYDQIAPSSCKPPLYKGCIVARRQFSFANHTQVVLPITIDPICKDVPCDAFSTCRTGKCFKANTDCTDGTCLEPGDPGDGGTSADGQVIPDTGVDSSMPDSSKADGGTDSGLDGASDGSLDSGTDADSGDSSVANPGVVPYCNGTTLHCTGPNGMPADQTCLPMQECCMQPTVLGMQPVCSPQGTCLVLNRYCCPGGPDYCGAGNACNVLISGGVIDINANKCGAVVVVPPPPPPPQ